MEKVELLWLHWVKHIGTACPSLTSTVVLAIGNIVHDNYHELKKTEHHMCEQRDEHFSLKTSEKNVILISVQSNVCLTLYHIDCKHIRHSRMTLHHQ